MTAMTNDAKTPEQEQLRKLILDTVSDLGADFMYYDRKSDEKLTPGMIQKGVAIGAVTIDEIVHAFRAQVQMGMEERCPAVTPEVLIGCGAARSR